MNWKNIKSSLLLFFDKCKKIFFQFIVWREKRIVRFHSLPKWRKIGNTLLTFFGVFLFYIILVDINFLWLFGKSPSIRAIANPPQSLSSEIISADGKTIGKYFNENRKLVKYEDISPTLINTLICTEDIRYYKHFGIDFKGLASALRDAISGRPRGASTITQQLVKNMYRTRSQYSTGFLGSLPGLRLFIEKTKEWTAATKLEIFYSKQDIITMYLNTVSFGSNAYGIHTASKTYFNTTSDKLTYEQSAILIGTLKAITRYNPYLYPENALKRRNIIFQLLVKNKYVTQHFADSLKKKPLILNYNVEKPNEGIAPYFRAYLTRFLESWGEMNGYDVYSDGLKIYVTLDSRLQEYAEKAVQKQMKTLQNSFFQHWSGQNPWRDENGIELPNFIENLVKKKDLYKKLQKKYNNNEDSIWQQLNKVKKIRVFDYNSQGYKEFEMSTMDSIRYMSHFLHCGFVAMEPDTKYVKAWVGDVNFDYWQYDKVAQSRRQPGSTFKLFVYAAALINGKSPCDTYSDTPIDWKYDDKTWSPKNATGGFSYSTMTMKRAFAQSINSVAAKIAQEVGIPAVAKTARLMGIHSNLVQVPPLSLGSSDVSLLEMVNAYSTAVGEGMQSIPIFITKIVDKDGYVIYEPVSKPRRVISYENSFLLTEILKGGITEPGGTSRALWNYDLMRWDTEFGGKTGTSSNYSDAWYVGVTPKLVGGAWVGAEHRSIHFRTGNLGQGSRTALPIFALFMEKVLSDKNFKHYRAKFPSEPKEHILRDYKCESFYEPDTTLVDSTLLINPDTEFSGETDPNIIPTTNNTQQQEIKTN